MGYQKIFLLLQVLVQITPNTVYVDNHVSMQATY